MTTLVVGATGATGRWLVRQLLEQGHEVRVVVRSPERLPDDLQKHERLRVITGNILTMPGESITELVRGCDAVASCLGHTISLRGVFGPPRRLVTDTTRRLCDAIRTSKPARPVRFVLMNTVANMNRDLPERRPVADRIVIGLVRALVPPQGDNQEAADLLRLGVGSHDPSLEWAAVRPDSLTNESTVTGYDVHASPIRSGVFDPGKTSRINVGHFMAALMTDGALWTRWKGQMPVIYNREAA